MRAEDYRGDIVFLIQQNRFLWTAVGGLIAALVLVLLVAWTGMGSNRTTIVPPKIEKSFWVTDNTASGSYIEQMAQWASFLILDVTPDNVHYKSEILLGITSPDFHGLLKQKLDQNAQRIKRENSTSSFDVKTVKSSPDKAAAIMTGLLKISINGSVVKNELRHYFAQFSLSGGSAQLIQFREVKNDSLKAALGLPNEEPSKDEEVF